MNIKELRKKIDNLDGRIIGLLNERTKVSLEVGKLKTKSGQSIYSPDRDKHIYRYENCH